MFTEVEVLNGKLALKIIGLAETTCKVAFFLHHVLRRSIFSPPLLNTYPSITGKREVSKPAAAQRGNDEVSARPAHGQIIAHNCTQ